MPQKPPPPLAQSFLVCRELFQDIQTGEHILVGPCTGGTFPSFPITLRLCFYIKLAGGHGRYRLSLQLRDPDGELVGECSGPEDVHQADPLAPCQIAWRNVTLSLPRPGRYDLIVLTNGEDLAHHAFDANLKREE